MPRVDTMNRTEKRVIVMRLDLAQGSHQDLKKSKVESNSNKKLAKLKKKKRFNQFDSQIGFFYQKNVLLSR